MGERVRVGLVVDASTESKHAQTVLEKAKIPFRLIPIQDPEYKPRYILSREGDFQGIEQILEFVEIATSRPPSK